MISLCTFQVFLSIAAFGPEMTPEILKETWKVGNPNAHEKSRDWTESKWLEWEASSANMTRMGYHGLSQQKRPGEKEFL